jgi:hypothetical protein
MKAHRSTNTYAYTYIESSSRRDYSKKINQERWNLEEQS